MKNEFLDILREIRPSRMRPIYAFFRPYLLKYRWFMLLAIFVSALNVAFMAAQPLPLKFVFDYILHYKRVHAQLLPLYDFLSDDKEFGMVVICAMVMLISLGRAVTDYFSTMLATHVGQRVVVEIRARMFEQLQRLSLAYHTKSRSGDLLMRLTGDVNLLRELFVGLLISFLSDLLVIVMMASVMLYLDWRLALCSLSIMPILAFVTVGFGMRIRHAAHRQRRKESEVSVTAHESLLAIPIIQSFGREREAQKVFDRQTRGSFREGMRASRLEAMASQSIEILLGVGTVLVLWYGVEGARGNPPKGTPGDLLMFYFYLRMMYRPIRNFAKLVSRTAKAAASAERVMDVLRETPDIVDAPDAVAAPRFRGEIEFRNVHFAYRSGEEVLRGVDLRIAPGEKIALLGMSGAGKSTLTALLSRFYDPTKGQVLIDGVDIRRYTLRSLRKQVGIVLQESMLFAGSIRDNIAFGKTEASDEAIATAASRAQAGDFIDSMPENYSTRIGERGSSLSQGQRQRISLARCFLKKAPVVILDEPTSNVDVKSERRILRAVEKLIRNSTCILITHNVKMIHFADRIVVLHHGKIAESGTHEELMTLSGRYAEMVGLQTRGQKRRVPLPVEPSA